MKSLEAAREEGQQIEERARASKRSTAEPQSPEPKARRRPHTDDETENGSGGDGDDDSDDDPLAYLRKKVSAKAKNKAKAKSKAKANQGSPLKNARTPGVRRTYSEEQGECRRQRRHPEAARSSRPKCSSSHRGHNCNAHCVEAIPSWQGRQNTVVIVAF